MAPANGHSAMSCGRSQSCRGSVGRHLQILRAAGLLERRRVGRSVLYHRSPAGDLLLPIQGSV